MANIRQLRELEVYQMAMDGAMRIFELSKRFPGEERFSLTDQIRRCSRSVCANLAEAWRKRRYPQAFVSKLSDGDAEAAETQVWLEFAVKCGYLDRSVAAELYAVYDNVQGKLIMMLTQPEQWAIGGREDAQRERRGELNTRKLQSPNGDVRPD